MNNRYSGREALIRVGQVFKPQGDHDAWHHINPDMTIFKIAQVDLLPAKEPSEGE